MLCLLKGVVQIVKCGHRLCLSCFKRRQKSVEKDIKVQMCNYHPTCASTFSKFAAERFMEKIEGVCLKVSSPERNESTLWKRFYVTICQKKSHGDQIMCFNRLLERNPLK